MRNIDTAKVREIARIASERIQKKHIGCFTGLDKPLFLISEQYPGLWLEHAYDAVFYASMKPEYVYLAENTVNFFIDRQTEDGQLPFAVMRDGQVRYSQIQECVSFYSLCLEVYRMNRDAALLARAYESGRRWDNWLRRHRMTTGRGLVEMFFGYDTGHDNSGRLEGMACGVSSGTNVAAAKRLARKLGPGKTVVTVLPDTAERYYSTPLFDGE